MVERSIELHCHLDGSMRLTTIVDLARQQGLRLERPAAELATLAPGATSLVDYIAAIDVAIDVLQTEEALYRAAFELVEDWHLDGTVYGEARFAPAQHQRQGLAVAQVVAAVAAGLTDASNTTGVGSALLLGCMRPGTAGESWSVVEAAVESPAVVGIDLTGPEAGVRAQQHKEPFRAARAAGLRVTAHAGEASGAENVWQAIEELGAERIGHGTHSADDRELLRRLAEDQILLEVCPTSNVQTGAVSSLAAHPLPLFRASGVPVAIGCDSRTVSGTTMVNQHALVQKVFGWSAGDWASTQQVAAAHAFTPGAVQYLA